jgi:hypothetical protein
MLILLKAKVGKYVFHLTGPLLSHSNSGVDSASIACVDSSDLDHPRFFMKPSDPIFVTGSLQEVLAVCPVCFQSSLQTPFNACLRRYQRFDDDGRCSWAVLSIESRRLSKDSRLTRLSKRPSSRYSSRHVSTSLPRICLVGVHDSIEPLPNPSRSIRYLGKAGKTDFRTHRSIRLRRNLCPGLLLRTASARQRPVEGFGGLRICVLGSFAFAGN